MISEGQRLLDVIACLHGTDKSSHGHGYCPTYERYLGDMRNRPIHLVELGFYKGASARMWCDYFTHPDARLEFVDIDESDPALAPDPRVVLRHGDQADPALARRMPNGHARERDSLSIVVDDASHLSSKTIASFELWWPYLHPGGLYVIEDTHTSYHDWWYGPEESNPDPATSQLTTMNFAKRLADSTNASAFPTKHEIFCDGEVQFVHFYRDLVVVRKQERSHVTATQGSH